MYCEKIYILKGKLEVSYVFEKSLHWVKLDDHSGAIWAASFIKPDPIARSFTKKSDELVASECSSAM